VCYPPNLNTSSSQSIPPYYVEMGPLFRTLIRLLFPCCSALRFPALLLSFFFFVSVKNSGRPLVHCPAIPFSRFFPPRLCAFTSCPSLSVPRYLLALGGPTICLLGQPYCAGHRLAKRLPVPLFFVPYLTRSSLFHILSVTPPASAARYLSRDIVHAISLSPRTIRRFQDSGLVSRLVLVDGENADHLPILALERLLFPPSLPAAPHPSAFP